MLDFATWQKMHRVLDWTEHHYDYAYTPRGGMVYVGDPYRKAEGYAGRFDRLLGYAKRIWDMDEYTVSVYCWLCGRYNDGGWYFPAYKDTLANLAARNNSKN